MKPSSSQPKSTPTPCCTKLGIKRGPWTPEEDEILASYIRSNGEGRWRTLPKRAGLLRCGKSCRLRWVNYLRPSLKKTHIAPDEEDLILRLHRLLGNRWSLIAGRIPGRTDNEIKNFWNTHMSKKLISQGIDPRTHKPLNPSNTSKSHHDPSPSVSHQNPNLGQVCKNSEIREVTNHDQHQTPWNNYDGLMSNEDQFTSLLDSFMNQTDDNMIAPLFQHNLGAQMRSAMDSLAGMQNVTYDYEAYNSAYDNQYI